jgi:hypothetical protein
MIIYIPELDRDVEVIFTHSISRDTDGDGKPEVEIKIKVEDVFFEGQSITLTDEHMSFVEYKIVEDIAFSEILY